jgi:2-C-methyl-D-erythritol 4-phosphate cytidylyltransferase
VTRLILEWAPRMNPASPSPSAEPRLWALIPCAGSGARSGAVGPKQYFPLAGKPLVRHTLAAFAQVPRLAAIAVIVSPGDQQLRDLDAPFLVADCGGSTRAETVFNGLNFLLDKGGEPQDWVLVHDAARCLVEPAWIDRLIDACLSDAVGGLLAQPVADTLKSGPEGRARATVDRRHIWQAQTPQMFRLGALREALQVAGAQVTDEASAMEFMGLAPRLVPGSARNIKVTYPDDFALAEALLSLAAQRRSPS